MTAPVTAAPAVCVCGAAELSRKRYPTTWRIEYACDSVWFSDTGEWDRPCLPAFHLAAAAQAREQALVAEVERLRATAENILENEHDEHDACRYCQQSDYPVDKDGNRLPYNGTDIGDLISEYQIDHEEWCPSMLLAAALPRPLTPAGETDVDNSSKLGVK